MNFFEVKNSGEKITDVDTKQGIITGYLSAFNNIDADNDVVKPGAFLKTIKENGPGSGNDRIKFLINHDATKPVGKFTELKEDDHGLKYVATIGKHAGGRDFLQMVEDGLVTEHSIGYRTIQKSKGDGVTYLNEIKLYEGSGLTGWGSNPKTPVVSLKEFPQQAAERLAILTKAHRDGSYEDEVYPLLEIEIKQLQQYFEDQKTTQAAKAPEPAIVEAELQRQKEIKEAQMLFAKLMYKHLAN